MSIINNNIWGLIIIVSLNYGCNTGPKVIKSELDKKAPFEQATDIFKVDPESLVNSEPERNQQSAVNQVVIKESLPTSKYIYLLVNNGKEDYWIATNKQDVKIGGRYFYRGGLLKTNFESREHQRVFDKIYLVSLIIPVDHATSVQTTATNSQQTKKTIASSNPLIEVKGSTQIARIVASPENFSGKKVQVSGRCVKINKNIMGRHWIHIQDGSRDDYDFVVTSETAVPEGHQITVSGVISLQKDFGSGYHYDIIMEEGVVKSI